MSIFRCIECDRDLDSDYIECHNDECIDCAEARQPEPNYATQADLDNYLESLSDNPEVMDVLRRLGRL